VDSKIEKLEKKRELMAEYKRGVMQKIFSQEIRFSDEDGKKYPEWVEKRIGDIATTYYQGINTTADNITYSKDGYPILQAKHITGEFLDFSDTRYVDEKNFNNYKFKYMPKKNDILISNIGTLGKILLIDKEIKFLIAWNIFKISLNEIICIPLYVKHFLKKVSVDGYFERVKTGNATKFVNKSDMLKIKINLPCLEEQEKIANFLSGIDKKIELIEQETEQVKEFKRGLLQQMFV
jgi:type I restriction enzyme S subunit